MLISRVTDPRDFNLIGVVPKDLEIEVGQALRRAGFDFDEIFLRSDSISQEWQYDTGRERGARFRPRYQKERTIPQKHRSLEEILDPQPMAQKVIQKLLGWIDKVDLSSQAGLPKPPFEDENGDSIFPPEGHEDALWYLTDLSRTKREEELARQADEDGPGEDEPELSDDSKEDIEYDAKGAYETDADDSVSVDSAMPAPQQKRIRLDPVLPEMSSPGAWTLSSETPSTQNTQ